MLDRTVALDRFAPALRNIPYAAGVVRKSGTHWYSMYPMAGPLLAMPLYLPLAAVPAIRRMPPATLIAVARITEKFVAVTWAAAAATLLLALMKRLAAGRAALLLTLIFALGTGNWSIASQAMWQHTFGMLAIVACLYSVERWAEAPRWHWLAGALAGCAVAIRPTNAALVLALALALWASRARLQAYLRVFALPVLAAVATATANFALFHNVGGRYSIRLDMQYPMRIAGLLFSPGRGLAIYTPIALLALAAFSGRARLLREKHRSVFVASAAFIAFDIAFTATWSVWWGGYCWGPRLLTEILPCLVVLIAIGWPALQRSGWKEVFAVAAVYGCFIQMLGVYCYPKGHWDRLPVSVDAAPARLWDWTDNPIARTARGGFAWEPYAIAAAAIKGGLPASAARMKALGVTPY